MMLSAPASFDKAHSVFGQLRLIEYVDPLDAGTDRFELNLK